MRRISWGGVLIGALAGLGVTAVLAVIAFAAGLRVGESAAVDAGFVIIQFVGQLSAGFFGGRFGRPLEAINGALASLVLFAVTAVISSAGGAEVGALVLLGSGVVALVVGSAGGVLGSRRN